MYGDLLAVSKTWALPVKTFHYWPLPLAKKEADITLYDIIPYYIMLYIALTAPGWNCNIQNIHTCIHTYIRTYVHTYIRTYVHTYIHTYIHIYTVYSIVTKLDVRRRFKKI